jgi:hypothetical protein
LDTERHQPFAKPANNGRVDSGRHEIVVRPEILESSLNDTDPRQTGNTAKRWRNASHMAASGLLIL